MPLFDLASLQKPLPEVTGSGLVLKERFLNVHLKKIESIKQLIGQAPGVDEVFCLWTLNSFNAFTFIPFMIKEHGRIDELILSTYAISSRILHAFSSYIDKGLIGRVHITISDSIKYRQIKNFEELTLMQSKYPDFTVSYGWNHSKITLIQNSVGYFVIEGSGNYSENAQHEQYMFLNSKNLYMFRKTCIQSVQNGTH